jgi:hypothetical protein
VSQLNLNFDELLHSLTSDFVGRDWLLNDVSDFTQQDKQPYLLVVGEPGIGKSAFAAHLLRRREVHAYHFCLAREGGTLDPIAFVRSLSQQLVRSLPDFGRFLLEQESVQINVNINIGESSGEGVYGVYIDKFIVQTRSAYEAFQYLVREPISAWGAEHSDDQRVLLLVDGLDEAMRLDRRPNIVDLIDSTRDLPNMVRWVLTSRPGDHLDVFPGARLLIPDDSAENMRDVREYVSSMLFEPGISTTLKEHAVDSIALNDELVKRSLGNFLYLNHMRSWLVANVDSDINLDQIPIGLVGVYKEFLDRILVNKIETWRNVYRPILGVLAVAQESLHLEKIAAFSGASLQEANDVVTDLGQFLNVIPEAGNHRYGIYHTSFADFLSNRNQNPTYWIDPVATNSQIADCYLNAEADQRQYDDYGLNHLVHHLASSEREAELYNLVESLHWHKVRVQRDPSRRGYTDDLDLAFTCAIRRGFQDWAILISNSLLCATVASTAMYLPVEVYETLVRLDRGQEALERARIVPNLIRKKIALKRIEAAALELGQDRVLSSTREQLAGLSALVVNESAGEDKEVWLIDLVKRYGVDRTMSMLPRSSTHTLDLSKVVEDELRVANAAITAGRIEEACHLLLECVDRTQSVSEWEQKSLIPQIALALIQTGNEKALHQLLEMTLQMEHDQVRLPTLADLAMVCIEARNQSIRNRVVALAIQHITNAQRRTSLQFEIGKIALVLAIVNDARADQFVQEAISLAEKPDQAIWSWEEREAWMNLASALASTGLCDEALDLVEEKRLQNQISERFLVELARQDRWREVLHLLGEDIPSIGNHVLISVALVLEEQGSLDKIRYHDLVNLLAERNIEGDLSKRIETIYALLDLALLGSDNENASVYLSQLVNIVETAPEETAARAIKRTTDYAVRLNDSEVIQVIADHGKTLSEQSMSSDVVFAISVNLAALGKFEDSWSLAFTISDEVNRLEAFVRICENMLRSGQLVADYFEQALQSARALDNVGWLPSLWAKLAWLADKLDHQAKQECIQEAMHGTIKIVRDHHYGFNIFNCANVSEAFSEIGLSIEAHELLNYGLTLLEENEPRPEYLRSLVRVAISGNAAFDWPRALRIAQGIPDTHMKAQALLDVTTAMIYSGTDAATIGIATDVAESIQEVERSAFLIDGFAAMLKGFTQMSTEDTHNLIVGVYRRSRLKNRSEVLNWTAALFSVLSTISSQLPRQIWQKIEHTQTVLGHDQNK